MRWASLVLTLPVMLYSAAPFFAGAWRDARISRLGMDVPVALGLAVAFLASAWTTVAGAGEVYFDSVTMFVFLLLGGAIPGAARAQPRVGFPAAPRAWCRRAPIVCASTTASPP